MTSQDRLVQKMLELRYGLLDEDEAGMLREAIAEDPRVATAWTEANHLADKFSLAARSTFIGPVIKTESCDPQLKTVTPLSLRAITTLLVVAASLSAVIVGARYFREVPSLPQPSLAMQVARLIPEINGPPNQFRLTTINYQGPQQQQPVPAEVHAEVNHGRSVLFQTETRTDARGQGTISLPPNLLLPPGTSLQITGHAAATPSSVARGQVSFPLPSTRCLTYVKVDRPLYRPGETVYFRSLTLERHSFHGELDLPIRFELLDPSGAMVPSMFNEGMTQRGVGNGAFSLPQNLAGGEYTLVCKSLDGYFPDERCSFQVQAYRVPRFKKQLEFRRRSFGAGDLVEADFAVQRAEGWPVVNGKVLMIAVVDGKQIARHEQQTSTGGTCLLSFPLPSHLSEGKGQLTISIDDGGTLETMSKTIPIELGRVDVAFYPEGGYLVAGLANRVYFTAHNPSGRPMHIAGEVLDGNGARAAEFQTIRDGLGRFEITPQEGVNYIMKIQTPVDVTNSPRLPPSSLDHPVLDTGPGVFGKDEEIEFRLRSRINRRIVARATCRGVSVGSKTSTTRAGEQAFSLPVSAEAEGVIRLTVAEVNQGVETPLVERLVYRHPQRKLKVRIVDSVIQSAAGDSGPDELVHSPGDKLRLTVEVVDEQNRPTAAVLGAAVVDDAALSLEERERPNLLTHFLLASEVLKPEDLEHANFYLGDDPQAAQSLDLLLGTQGWRRFIQSSPVGKSLAEESFAESLARLAQLDGDSKELVLDKSNYGSIENVWTRYEEVRTAVRARLLKDIRWSTVPLLLILLYVVLRHARHRSMREQVISLVWFCLLATGLIGCGPQSTTTMFPESTKERIDANAKVAAAEFYEPKSGSSRPDVSPGKNADPLRVGPQGTQSFLIEPTAKELDHVALGNVSDPTIKDRLLERLRFPVREYAHQHRYREDGVREDFTETLYWHPFLQTDSSGRATLRFDLADSVTTFRVLVDAHSDVGRLGSGETSISARLPFQVEPKLPLAATEGDRIDLPVAVINALAQDVRVDLALECGDALKAETRSNSLAMKPNDRSRVLFPLQVVAGSTQPTEVRLRGQASLGQASLDSAPNGERIGHPLTARFHDEVRRTIPISTRGYPLRESISGVVRGPGESIRLPIPERYVANSLDVTLRAYPSPLADVLSGVESILREPHGCFEQASATNYPNAMTLHYLKRNGLSNPEVTSRAMGMLERGYRKLVGYECQQLGFEWFGHDPGHEALTAFGLMQFIDMSQLMRVESKLIARTEEWLLARRDGRGGFQRNKRHLHSWSVEQRLVDAYILWALSEAAVSQRTTAEFAEKLERELDQLIIVAQESTDAYLLSLAAAAVINAQQREIGEQLLVRLAMLQESDGGFTGKGSVVQSGGISLRAETTALAALAMMRGQPNAGFREVAERAIQWLLMHRQGNGGFGSTQGTVLALKAIVGYAETKARSGSDLGKLTVRTHGTVIASSFLPSDPLTGSAVQLTGLAQELNGERELELSIEGIRELPYSIDVSYAVEIPPTSPSCPIRLTTSLNHGRPNPVSLGSPLQVACTLENRTAVGLPMTVAVIGLPGGVEPRAEELNELRDAGTFDFYEVQPNEVVLYWRGLAPQERKIVEFTVSAAIPGYYTGPAPRAYLYYTAEQKTWDKPLAVEIE
jgi:hypothetical protein